MARTTQAAVIAQLTDDYDATAVPDLSLHIDTASDTVDDVCLNSGYSDARLERIERLLACHFYHLKDRRSQSEGVGGISQSYQTKTGMFFELTEYGQWALMSDSAGNLAALQKRMEMGAGVLMLEWLGTEIVCEDTTATTDTVDTGTGT